jgi:fatty-acyl-CoA synthase
MRNPSMTASWWVHRWAELDPERIAVVFRGSGTTYGELDQRVDAACCWLQSLGVEKGDRTAVLLRNCPEFLEIYLACSRLGSIFVPLNFRLTPEELRYLIAHSRPRTLVYGQEYQDQLDSLDDAGHLSLPARARVGRSQGQRGGPDYRVLIQPYLGRKPQITPSVGPSDAEEPQVIMYTSGTTGRPKGAVLSHRKTFFNCLNAEIFFELSMHDVVLILTPLFHSGGLFIQASPSLYKGATIVLRERFDPLQGYADIERYKVTQFQAVTTMYRSLLEVRPEDRGDTSSLRICAIGGEPVTPSLITDCMAAGFPMRQIMGQTETSIMLWASQEDLLERPGTVGIPVFHAEVDLQDENGRCPAPNQVGEIVVRGSITMNEYWRDPERSSEIMRGGWLRTGDLATRDEDGYFYLVDRAKDMYISGGENVYPAEVEQVLLQHPDVRDAAVVGCPDGRWGEAGHAFVIPRPGCEPTLEGLLRLCEGKLAKFKWPHGLTLCTDLPRTATGKVQKWVLKKQFLNTSEHWTGEIIVPTEAELDTNPATLSGPRSRPKPMAVGEP